ncbi:ABC transporter substrate-binding protein [Halomonas citrativorans]|uniref:ABC transporter substrate-binding protein n=1 Tax=Halomonas citrativorans TaxID=2742612 RepID=A0ABR9FCG6_9GAMM|nr:ABC transporter substrate-binding protein [Halomonas citrativorans]MBE0404185.1 ABC transporter substrate-binding protein [Halomonas citrativorans]
MRRTVTLFFARAALLLTSLLAFTSAHAQFATVDWTIAETLVAIDAPISGVAQQKDYYDWVGEPQLPASATDLGLRTQPNFELLAQLAPEQILISPMFAALTPRLERIAPVTSIPLYSPGADTWQEMQALTRQLGELTKRKPQAEQLIANTQVLMESLREARPDTAPLLLVQFMDARHVRIFGDNSLYNAVLGELGLKNAWEQPTNAWGFTLTGIEVLAHYSEATLVIIDPLPIGVEEALAESGLWQQIPIVQSGNLLRLPPVWSFGALPSAQRFARVLTAGLDDFSRHQPSPR